jgi:hypothetical protein
LIWILLEKLKVLLKILRGDQEKCACVYIDEISRKEKRKCENKKKRLVSCRRRKCEGNVNIRKEG